MTLPTTDPAEAVADRQPPELRHETIWRDCAYAFTLIARYLRADPWLGTLLVAIAFGMTSFASYLGVKMSVQLGAVIDALSLHNGSGLWSGFFVLLLMMLGLSVVAVIMEAANNFLLIRWRTVFTRTFLARWMADDRYYWMRWDSRVDNPEQRIQEDISSILSVLFMTVTNVIGQATLLMASAKVLWGLSQPLPLQGIGLPFAVPADLIMIALVTGPLWTIGAHYIGRVITRLEVVRQRFEADFRLGMGQTREWAEAIAFERGAAREEQRSLLQYERIRTNWIRLTFANMRLNGFNAFGSFAPRLIPIALMAPRIMAGHATVGDLTAAVAVFGNVLSAMTYFATHYAEIATLRGSIARMRLFETELSRLAPAGVSVHERGGDIQLDGLELQLPDGASLLTADKLSIALGDHVLIRGRSGVGKSTLLRAIAGLWPHGAGTVRRPRRERILFLPQRSYMPDGTLAGLLTYPAEPDPADGNRYAAVLRSLSLDTYVARLDEFAEWRHILSPGEQQRIAAARAILRRPDYLFLDEATSALDVDLEAELYNAIAEALPRAAIISVAHRPTVSRFHATAIEIRNGAAHGGIQLPRPLD